VDVPGTISKVAKSPEHEFLKVIPTPTEVFLTLTEVFLTLTEVFPCFFLSCKANDRVTLAKMGHGPHFSKLVVICVLLYIVCV